MYREPLPAGLFRAGLPLVLTAVIFAFPAGRAPAQADSDEPSPLRIQVFPLKYHKVQDLARVVQTMFTGTLPPVAVGVDERSNSLIVSAPAKVQNSIKELIATLDRPQTGKANQEITVHTLRHLEPDAGLEKRLRELLPDVRLALDRPHKQVLFAADPGAVEKTLALLNRLDVLAEQAKPAMAEVRVRVVWLVAGEALANLPTAGDDLKEVVAALAQVGVKESQVIAQVTVNTQVNAPFEVQGSGVLHGVLKAAGTVLSESGGTPRLQISIETSSSGKEETPVFTPVSKLSTTITAPLGHAVVLGMTPTGGTKSIFVVQVLAKEQGGVPPARR